MSVLTCLSKGVSREECPPSHCCRHDDARNRREPGPIHDVRLRFEVAQPASAAIILPVFAGNK